MEIAATLVDRRTRQIAELNGCAVGELAVVPKGLWHSPQPIGEVTLVYVTPLEKSEISDEDDPR